MTVGELRAQIADLPDGAPVWIYPEDHGEGVCCAEPRKTSVVKLNGAPSLHIVVEIGLVGDASCGSGCRLCLEDDHEDGR